MISPVQGRYFVFLVVRRDALLMFAGSRPGSRSAFLSEKVDKTIDAQPGQIQWDGR